MSKKRGPWVEYKRETIEKVKEMIEKGCTKQEVLDFVFLRGYSFGWGRRLIEVLKRRGLVYEKPTSSGIMLLPMKPVIKAAIEIPKIPQKADNED